LTTDEFGEEAYAHVESLVDLKQVRAILREALDQLSDRDRELIGWRVVEQLPYDIIAGRLQCSPGASRVRVSRSLARLRCQMASAVGETADEILSYLATDTDGGRS
jgi:RNA polymerase sigma factor (sigma-70 family)